MSKDYSLSLSGAAFDRLRNDFDTTLRDVLAGMIDTDQNAAEINVKVKITLTDDSAPDFSVAGGQQTREITKPRFDHTVTYVIQRKEKKVGSFSGNYELVFDRASGQYYCRDIDNGQTSIFDEDRGSSEVIDAEYTAIEDGPRGLPEAAESDDVLTGEDTPGDTGDAIPEAAGEFEEERIDPARDPSKPFGWMRQFIGEAMHVTEAMGNYTVRTDGNKVVLSSATSPENPFYCDAEKLAPHVGHTVMCVGYGYDEDLGNISIECKDCDEVLFSLDTPNAVTETEDAAETFEEAGGTEEEADVTDEESGYEYEEPEV